MGNRFALDETKVGKIFPTELGKFTVLENKCA